MHINELFLAYIMTFHAENNYQLQTLKVDFNSYQPGRQAKGVIMIFLFFKNGN
jgi:hypothetical protein